MYEEFYNLKENPFNITADPEFFFLSTRHSEAFSHLEFGIKQRTGIILITGEIGTGKTTLCRTLLNRLDKSINTALILNPSFSDLQLLQFILKDFGIEVKAKNKFALIDALNNYLIKETNKGNNVVLIVDEAQNLKPKQLEQIRLLSNLETEKQKLLQIVLVGQPELLGHLKDPSLRQVNQRISVRYHILPLDRNELRKYIEHRINVATKDKGKSTKLKITEKAFDMIYENSKGTPRTVNILCDRALLAGYVQETYTIDEHLIQACLQEVNV